MYSVEVKSYIGMTIHTSDAIILLEKASEIAHGKLLEYMGAQAHVKDDKNITIYVAQR